MTSNGKSNTGPESQAARPDGAAPSTETAETPPAISRVIGGYRLVRKLGEGGMGVVYEAEQQHPHRPVALKVVRGGRYVDTHHVKLFQREAEALARLKHPGIGAIYEAGRTEAGEHFFAMELVRGEPLHEYVRAKKPPVRERLKLFCRICDAINYAHQRGVMHRDLKPSNILIDADRSPKILDFGLARITDSDISVTTVVTEIGRVVGTLAYMSPEQARGNPDEIDLRSDVYSLGVILYELLTGALPYDVTRGILHEAVRVICEERPRRPSTISRTLRGDVETIALKALEKEPSRRYQSASALADDVERYLTDQPIQARPPSAMYQFRKLVARHKAPFAFIAAMFAVVLGFGVWMSVLYARAETLRQEAVAARDEQSHARAEAVRERQRTEDALAREEEQRKLAEQREKETEQVAEFQASQLSGIDTALMGVRLRRAIIEKRRAALAALGLDAEAVEASVKELESGMAGVNFTNVALQMLDENIFERALKAIDEQFADSPLTGGTSVKGQPLVRARLLETVAAALCELGLLDKAVAPQIEALAIHGRILGDEHPLTLRSVQNMGALLVWQGMYSEAEPYLRAALDGHRRVLGEDHPHTLTAIHDMGFLLGMMGKLAEAEPYLRQALEGHRRVLGDDHLTTLNSIGHLGGLFVSMGKYAEAERYYREALEASRRALGEEHPGMLTAI